MDQNTLRQYEHRVGCVLVGEAFCDGCNHRFGEGEMAFRCLECSGFICPGAEKRPVRQTEITTTTRIQDGAAIQLATSETALFSGYDLCLTCAKKTSVHSHHRFTLAVYRKKNSTYVFS
ncbi:unnamed protein product [Adineta ricciae]|uniref:Uncharacterized protein n=1 Tax=Adineta ricciae TaxID=249248 RepID=A0A815HC51_ADIRI|nr:unnamed protein product [Adineta ricciae]